MSRRKYEEEYEEEEYEEEEEELDLTQQAIEICQKQINDILKNTPDDQERFNMWVNRLEHLKKCEALDAQAKESIATKTQAEMICAEAKSDKIFKISQLVATVATPIITETIRSIGATRQVHTVVDYEREGNIFKTGATPFMKKL